MSTTVAGFLRGIVAAGLFCAWPAAAHHSNAMFDGRQKVELTGTVRAFQWTNPHCYIQLVVPGASGSTEEWSLEMAAPVYLQQQGWKPVSLRPGDTVTVVLNPLRRQPAQKGGLVLAVRDSAGRPIGKARDKAP